MALSLERDTGCKISAQRKFIWQRASPTKFVGLAAASWAWAKLTSTLQRGFYPLAYPPVVTPPVKAKRGHFSDASESSKNRCVSLSWARWYIVNAKIPKFNPIFALLNYFPDLMSRALST